jgi:hypothetical protein
LKKYKIKQEGEVLVVEDERGAIKEAFAAIIQLN